MLFVYFDVFMFVNFIGLRKILDLTFKKFEISNICPENNKHNIMDKMGCGVNG